VNDTLWIFLLIALTGAGGRLAKLYPKLPKKLMPILALALGAGLYVLKATQIDGLPAADALLSWQVILTGASTIAGHDLLKGALQCVGVSESTTTKILGQLARPNSEIKPKPPSPAGSASSMLWLWTAVCWIGIGAAAVVTPGCGAGAQARVADAMAKAVNKEVKPQLLAAYEKEGDAAIPAPDRETSDKQIAAVDERWKPVWDAIEAFAVVHDQWATAIETGGAVDLEEVLAAFCKLVGLAKPWLKLPDIPGVACPAEAP
jgi:hypothetical protein